MTLITWRNFGLLFGKATLLSQCSSVSNICRDARKSTARMTICSAFDSTDHAIFIWILKYWVGISGWAILLQNSISNHHLDWFKTCGVPQGHVVGPNLLWVIWLTYFIIDDENIEFFSTFKHHCVAKHLVVQNCLAKRGCWLVGEII